MENDPAPGKGSLAKAAALLCLFLGIGLVLAPLLGAAARPRVAETGAPASLETGLDAAGSRGTAAPTGFGTAAPASRRPSLDAASTTGSVSGPSGGLIEGLSLIIAERERAASIAAKLAPDRLGKLDTREIETLLGQLFDAARRGGMEPAQALAKAFPQPEAATSLISSDRDLQDFKAAGRGKGRAAEHYAKMAALVPKMRALRSRYELMLKAAYREGGGRAAVSTGLGLPSRRAEIYPPSKKSLDYVHPYALDIFFISVQRFAGGVERGPEVLSVAPGIVLAMAADWSGGPGQASYRDGGFSPNSGNGVIAYDPGTRRFYSYFHLSELAVKPGSIIQKGTVLGRGGDTGSNARKDGHGGHVHVEIFDAAHGRPLPAREIRELLFGK